MLSVAPWSSKVKRGDEKEMEVTFHPRLESFFSQSFTREVTCKVKLYCFRCWVFLAINLVWTGGPYSIRYPLTVKNKKKELLLTSLLFSAENVKYQVKLRGETWENYLAELGSTKYPELANRIKKAVNISLLLFLFVIFWFFK